MVTPDSYAALAGLNGNASSVARALDSVRPAAGTRPDAARQEVFDALYTAASGALPGALSSLSGQSYADARMTMMNAQRTVSAALNQRLTAGWFSRYDQFAGLGAAGYASLGNAPAVPERVQPAREGALWGQALYGFGRRGGDTNGAGSSFGLAGALIGAETTAFQTGTIGAALGYTRATGDPKADAAGRVALDNYSLATYGRTDFGALTLRGSIGASYGKTDIRRTIQLGNAQRVAHGEADSYGFFGTAVAGYRLATLAGLDLSPEAGINLQHSRQDGLIETQAGAFALTLRGQNQTSARSLAGARLSTPLNGDAKLRLDLKAYWSHEFADNVAVLQASLLGASFVTRSPGAARDGAVIGASLSGFVTPQIELAGSYDGDLRLGATTHRFSFQAMTRW
ncbi:autotransporter outer membrane beta-barrel domain-containing protein [Bosea thiooxidans]|nr:autotransporter outer membrane beta-barrel domain-containing protein [Bosea sp. (in: a-proteobacteria)]